AGGVDLPAGDPGVVEGAVEPAVGADHTCDHRPYVLVARDLAREGYGLPAGSVDEGHRFAGGFHPDIGDRDTGALAREGESGGAADAAAPTRDQRRLPLQQPGHRSSPRSIAAGIIAPSQPPWVPSN